MDRMLFRVLAERSIPFAAVFTKLDKVAYSERKAALAAAEKELAPFDAKALGFSRQHLKNSDLIWRSAEQWLRT
jgi:GTP-binding protein EngB required for normal cell division